jgi:AcrR family transcriptional regulator
MTRPAAAGPSGRRRGRRGGGEDTRAALLAAARVVFAEQGYQGATVRAIAARAGVDAAMVNHWFGGKQGLFTAIVELPFDPMELLDHILVGDRETLAERLIRTFVPLWDAHEGGFTAVLLSIANQDLAAQMGEFFVSTIFGRLAETIEVDQPEVRAGLCASQVLGLGLVRYVLKLEPVASADVDTVVTMVGPNLQRYLTGDLDSPAK